MSNPYRLAASLPVSSQLTDGEAAASAICFTVEAVAEPSLTSRVLGQFAKRGLMPARLVADGERADGLLDIDIEVADLTTEDGEHIARSLRAIVGVCLVRTSEKRRPNL